MTKTRNRLCELGIVAEGIVHEERIEEGIRIASARNHGFGVTLY